MIAATTVQPASTAAVAAAEPQTLPIVYAAQFAQQTAALREDGYNVRNTFIDSPVVWWESCSPAPRSSSSPPVAGRVPDRRFTADEDIQEARDDTGFSSGGSSGSIATAPAVAHRAAGGRIRGINNGTRSAARGTPRRSPSCSRTTVDRSESSPLSMPAENPTACAEGSSSSGSRCSSVNLPSDSTPSPSANESTACSDNGEAGSSGGRERSSSNGAELAQEDQDALQSIADLVEARCAFLRLNGHTLHMENATRMRSRGIIATLRFYAYGLPWPKRAKWVQPLCRSVAAILRQNGCETKILGGDLQVTLKGDSAVRVDFSAARL